MARDQKRQARLIWHTGPARRSQDETQAFSVPSPSALRPMFEWMRKAKQKFMLDIPFQLSRHGQKRVIYVNRLRRAGVPGDTAMRLVNHSSEPIPQI